jgi:23S rRNA pseudouridine1911/1915/1917 synthase
VTTPPFIVSTDHTGQSLARYLRGALGNASWNQTKGFIETGKVFVNDRVETDPGRRLCKDDRVALKMAAPDAKRKSRPRVEIVYEDNHLIVINKPAGVSSVPYELKETDTAMDLIRDAWRLKKTRRSTAPLYVVHRIDRATSGLLVYGLTRIATRGLSKQFREHTTARCYLLVAHGAVRDRVIESHLVSDRGDGLRGSSRFARQGKFAKTHVRAKERLRGATVCEVRLETGRTHQIRIHLAEAGHPLVGEKVYSRDFEKAGRDLLPSPRLLLHAQTLGFEHPMTGERLSFTAPVPDDMLRVIDSLRQTR